ncbi:ExeM/NucH family extracellular endonuclease [Georgenia yuyongxinii]|uniref:ExeM/NucH family extracellular endonuclease n=1 Tax=Georgenia yuyongxinii TaxID=2589797 RepID=UPI001E5ACEEB|nr:ExeM/NucH family extracellular endonuclease [Georgenia yuyongxinii]
MTAAAAGALVAAPLAAIPAVAAPDGSGVVINEAYLVGGSSGQPYTHKFVELHNPTDAPVDLAGMSLQYKSAGGTSFTGLVSLSGTIPADGYFLVQGGANNNAGAGLPLPPPDQVAGSINPGGVSGVIALVDGTQALPVRGDAAGAATVVDLLGYGNADTYETAPAPAGQGTGTVGSLTRTDFADTDDNSADFAFVTDVTPQGSADGGGGDETVEATIAEIQGTGAASPLLGRTVVTRGVVTAAYPTGNFNGVYLQTPGTGADLTGHDASHGIFVFSGDLAQQAEVGQYLEVTGKVSEFGTLTEITADEWAVLDEPADPVVPAAIAFPATDAGREVFEGMLVAPQGDYTVTDTFPTNRFGSVGLAVGTKPLVQPSELHNPRTDRAGYDAVVAGNAARAVTLDDGSSWDYTNFNQPYHQTPIPYLSLENPVRVGAAVTFTDPVILDYRFQWNFQPVTQVTGVNGAAPATFENTREAAPEQTGGDIQLAFFNVLNYFTTTGDEVAGCRYFSDRVGDPVTVRDQCDPRGAAEQEDLERQQAKIVAAINALDAEVVALAEIENSARLGKPRDTALADLVDALNAAAGAGTWAYVPSPAAVPADEDVIRNALIYKAKRVVPVGQSQILIGDPAFANAREPLAQTFRALNPGGQAKGPELVVIANHFKSKGSGEGPGNDVDEGQGLSNADRKAQASALVTFASQYRTTPVFLVGDFNSYTAEDPLVVLGDAGYTNIGQTMTKEDTYSFGGLVGSLDHVFANRAATKLVTGADIWNINSGESVGLEYSRDNYNVTNLYDTSVFRSSDHDPVIVGLDVLPGTAPDHAWEKGGKK